MAGSLEILLSCFSFFLFVWGLGAAKTHGFSRNITPAKIRRRQDKLSHLHFYFHDNLGGPKPSAVIVAEAPTSNVSKMRFGAVVMMDDPLTEGPELSSKIAAYSMSNHKSLMARVRTIYRFDSPGETTKQVGRLWYSCYGAEV